jgi:pentatricopeptide repeat protein
MYAKGLVRDIAVVKEVAETMLKDELVPFLSDEKCQQSTLESFVTYMDQTYGTAWLTVTSSNILLDVFGLSGSMDVCLSVLRLMEARNLNPDLVSINTILAHCDRHKNVEGALDCVRILHVGTSEETCNILFRMAWRCRQYNLALVVWRYACLNGCVSSAMYAKVAKSLKKPSMAEEEGNMETADIDVTMTEAEAEAETAETKPPETKSDDLVESLWDWHIAAGRVITGLLKPFGQTQKQRQETENVVYTPLPFSAATRNDVLVRRFLDDNKSVNKKWRPRHPFWMTLLKAHQKDQQWTTAAKAKSSVRWGIDNAFTVEVDKRVNGKGANSKCTSKDEDQEQEQEQWVAQPWTEVWYREIDRGMLDLNKSSEP